MRPDRWVATTAATRSGTLQLSQPVRQTPMFLKWTTRAGRTRVGGAPVRVGAFPLFSVASPSVSELLWLGQARTSGFLSDLLILLSPSALGSFSLAAEVRTFKL